MYAEKEEEKIINRIKYNVDTFLEIENLAILEREAEDEHNLIKVLFFIVNDVTNLVKRKCDPEKIRQWREQENLLFLRFASSLKIALEQQRDYLDTVSDQLLSDGDIVAQKIAAAQKKIQSLLDEERTIMSGAGELLAQEDELRATRDRVAARLARKDELAAIKSRLAGIDVEKLQTEVAQLEKEVADFERGRQPLLTRQSELRESSAELRLAIEHLNKELARLEKTYGEEAQKISEHILQWIEKIRARRLKREEKATAYEEKLEKEAAELHAIEKKIWQHLKQINEFSARAMDNKKILENHFGSNKEIGHRFSGSLDGKKRALSDLTEKIAHLTEKIAQELGHFDDLLSKMHTEIQEIAAACKPRGISA